MNNESSLIYNDKNNDIIIEERCIIGTIAVGKSTFINYYKNLIDISKKDFNYSTELLLKKPFKSYLNDREKNSGYFQIMMMMWAETRRQIMWNEMRRKIMLIENIRKEDKTSFNRIILIERPIIENEIFALINYDNNNLSKEWMDDFYYPNYYALKKSYDNNSLNRTYIFLFNTLINCVERYKKRESTDYYPEEYFISLYKYYFYFLIDLIINIRKNMILLETNFEIKNIDQEFINNLQLFDRSLLIVKSEGGYSYNHYIRSKPLIKNITFNSCKYNTTNYNNFETYYQVFLKLTKKIKVIITFD